MKHRILMILAAVILLATTCVILDTISNIKRFEPVCRNEFGKEVPCPMENHRD